MMAATKYRVKNIRSNICKLTGQLRTYTRYWHRSASIVLKGRGFKKLCADKSGGLAISFTLTLLPVVVSVGAMIDFAFAYNARIRMQSDLDASLIAAIKQFDNYDEVNLKNTISQWFSAQTELRLADYSVDYSTIDVSRTDHIVSAIAKGSVNTTFMSILGIKHLDFSAKAAALGPATSYLNVYVAIDKSASMLLAATSNDQSALRLDKNINCEFACHDSSDPVYQAGTGSKIADNYYDYIKQRHKAELRADIAVSAAKELVKIVERANENSGRLKIGLYTLGETAKEVLAPTADFSTALKYLEYDEYGLTSSQSEQYSYFDRSLDALTNLVGPAGSGANSATPSKLVLILTDGVQSERNWVLYGNGPHRNVTGWKPSQSANNKKKLWNLVTPLNPLWCDNLKTSGSAVAILYTNYLPVTADWGYNATLAQPIGSSYFGSVWGGEIIQGVSPGISRHDYLPLALSSCASSPDLFLAADQPRSIEMGLASLFNQYVNSVRLIQ